MRSLLWATSASFVVYNAILAMFGSSSPSASSYLYGLALFLGPFTVLLLAARVGLAPLLAQIFAGIGIFFLVIVGWLSATNQALFVAPALLMVFGIFSVVVLLFAVVFRVLRSAVNRAMRT